MANVVVKVQDGSDTLLGRDLARLPTAGRIRAGIKVLTRRAAEHPRARAIYEQGVADGQSFDQIERAIVEALPEVKTPLVPRNVPWFTVRPQDCANPDLARQIMDEYGEDRGEGRRLYRFPVIFPSDHWQTVMPHELCAWGANDKRYWSQYSVDGRRNCMCRAPVPVDDTGRRTIRLFGGRKVVPRESNGGLCEPEGCAEYQARECNLSGRFVFFVPGIRSVSAFELHTNSFYAMNAAIQTFRAVAFLRGGRISGFLDRQHTPFFFTKKSMDVLRIDERGQAVRTPQWIIDLQAPVDVAALLREHEDDETPVMQAKSAADLLQGGVPGASAECNAAGEGGVEQNRVEPTLERVLLRANRYGIEAERFRAYADRRWGAGWSLNAHGRARAWDELDRHRNDPSGYRDKVDSTLKAGSGGRRA